MRLLTKTIACIGCGRDVDVFGKYRKLYCSRRCCSRHNNKKNGFSTAYPGISRATVGAIGELKACVDLLSKGYEVFRAVSPSCSCDLAILKDGHLFRIEVRTGYESKKDGTVHCPKKADESNHIDHFAVIVKDRIIYDPPLAPKVGGL